MIISLILIIISSYLCAKLPAYPAIHPCNFRCETKGICNLTKQEKKHGVEAGPEQRIPVVLQQEPAIPSLNNSCATIKHI
jgi:hypothetical protein